MTTVKQRLEFHYDLHDPQSVYQFPPAFAEFLARYGGDDDAQEFLFLLRRYVESVGDEDLSFVTICDIASQFADLIDVSGVPFENNTYLSVDRDQSPTAEDILEDLDRESENDSRPPLEPEYPDVLVLVQPGDRLPQLIYKAIVGLRREGYRKAGSNLAQQARQLLRSKTTYAEMVNLLRSYVVVDFSPALDAMHNDRKGA